MTGTITDPPALITSLLYKLSNLVPVARSNHSSTQVGPSASPLRIPTVANEDAPLSPTSPQRKPPFAHLVQLFTPEDQETIKTVLTTLHFWFPNELIPALDLLDRGLVGKVASRIEPLDSVTSPEKGATAELGKEGQHLAMQAGPPPPPPPNDQHARQRQQQPSKPEVFYVQSTSSDVATTIATKPSSSSFSTSDYINRHPSSSTPAPLPFNPSGFPPARERIYYEVRLQAWNCTCAAFTLSVFAGLNADHHVLNDRDEKYEDHQGQQGERTTKPPCSTARDFLFGGTLTQLREQRQHRRESHLDSFSPAHAHTTNSKEQRRADNTTPSSPRLPVPIPICKHLLATSLAANVPVLFDCIEI